MRDPNEVVWWVDAGYACGGIITDQHGTIIATAPIFRKWIGRNVDSIRVRRSMVTTNGVRAYTRGNE